MSNAMRLKMSIVFKLSTKREICKGKIPRPLPKRLYLFNDISLIEMLSCMRWIHIFL
jgi:hypothetical protein